MAIGYCLKDIYFSFSDHAESSLPAAVAAVVPILALSPGSHSCMVSAFSKAHVSQTTTTSLIITTASTTVIATTTTTTATTTPTSLTYYY